MPRKVVKSVEEETEMVEVQIEYVVKEIIKMVENKKIDKLDLITLIEILPSLMEIVEKVKHLRGELKKKLLLKALKTIFTKVDLPFIENEEMERKIVNQAIDTVIPFVIDQNIKIYKHLYNLGKKSPFFAKICPCVYEKPE